MNGGLPGPEAAPAQCEGEACQSPAGAPQEQTPASAGFRGAGNVDEKPARKHPKKKKHRHRRKAKRNRRAGR